MKKNTSYQIYLNSESWKSKRDKLFASVGEICADCGKKKKLQAHHLTYDNFGNEPLSDLLALCKTCHMERHGIFKFTPDIKTAQLSVELVYSKAYQTLNASSIKMLSYVLLQKKKEFNLLYTHFSKTPFNMNPNTINRSIDLLLAHGFIEVIQQGGRYKNDASLYKKTENWKTWEIGDIVHKRKPLKKRGFCKLNKTA